MPWSEEQVKTFNALAHGWNPKSKKLSGLKKLGKEKLKEMASEGVKKESPVSAALMKVSKRRG